MHHLTMIENFSVVIINNNLTNETNFLLQNVTSNSSLANEKELYPIRDSLKIVVPLTILYLLIFISGMVGNIITCIVIARTRTMHTATNYYLFSLAISDLLLLISGMPLEIYGIWYRYPFPFNEFICVLQGFAAETSANATVLTITAFTAERYIAICHPFLSHTMSKLSRAIKFILLIWFLAMGLAVPQILDLGITSSYDTCGIKNDTRKHVFTISSILCFVFPMVVITVLYILIGLQLRRSKIVGRATTANGNSIRLKTKYRPSSQRNILLTIDRAGKPNPLLLPENSNSVVEAVYHDNRQQVSQRITNSTYDEGRKNYSQKGCMGTGHVVNMLGKIPDVFEEEEKGGLQQLSSLNLKCLAVVVAFFVCWAPHHAQRLFAMNADQRYSEIYDILTHISGVLYFVSTCINPFLYNIMSYKFREAFKDTCARYLYRRGRSKYHHSTLSRNISQRSNSHSAHTCSSICSGQNNVQQANGNQILEQDLSLLKYTKRPLTVKFRRARQQNVMPQSGNIYDCDCNTMHGQYLCSHKSLQLSNQQPKPKYYYSSYSDGDYYARSDGTRGPRYYPNERDVFGENDSIQWVGCRNNLRSSSSQVSEGDNSIATIADNNPFSTTISHSGIYSMKRGRLYNSYSISRKECRIPPTYNSPYKSPEMNESSRKLEEKLQDILKDLVLYNGNNNINASQPGSSRSKIPKSKSLSSLVTKKSDIHESGKSFLPKTFFIHDEVI